MPADVPSTIVLILLTSADAVSSLWPYVVGGVVAAVLLSRIRITQRWGRLSWFPRPLVVPAATVVGAASPLPTMGAVPLVLKLQREGLPARAALAFVLASSLMNPQLFVLTLGALGIRFALAQLGAALVLSMALGLIFGNHKSGPDDRIANNENGWESGSQSSTLELVGHIGFYFLLGVIAGASLQVLLPKLGVLNWLSTHGWLSSPVLGWLGAPFYTCAGTAIPLARSLGQAGLGSGTLFAFLLVGPVLRGTALANLICLLPRRTLIACLAALVLAGGLLGLGFNLLEGGI